MRVVNGGKGAAAMHLPDLISDLEVLLALEPEEVGLCILQVLARWPAHIGVNIEQRSFVAGALQAYGPSPKQSEMMQAIREAWSWLEGQALLLPDPRYFEPNTARILSRKARRLAQDPKARKGLSGHRIQKQALHPNIREDVWALYQREKFDTAVFEAMKAVEVAVRDAAALQPTDIGASLMRKAFDVNVGKLSDMTTVAAERQALSDLFAGVIAAYKNPHSHRNVSLDDPDEAAEIILIANHLLRIVDARRP
jgi:uncharacterized protein (TIGR02391 family)